MANTLYEELMRLDKRLTEAGLSQTSLRDAALFAAGASAATLVIRRGACLNEVVSEAVRMGEAILQNAALPTMAGPIQ